MRRHLVLLFIALVYSQYVPDPATWRPIDGNGHNPTFVKYGATNVQLRRKGSAAYGDGISSPRLAKSGRPLPSPRLISDQVFRTSLDGVNPASRRGLTDFVTYWGQFIDHDFGLTGGPKGAAVPPQPLNIPVPLGDQYYDVNGYGNQSLPFYRSVYDVNTGISTPRQQVNLVTAWMDGSQVYGSDLDTANYLRLGVGGLLKSQMYQGAEYPPFNDGAIVMQNDARYANNSQLFSFGDVRGNENPGLTSLQILFLREHNRKAREYASLNPTWSDEQLYQEARKFVIALIQHITEEEYIPVTLGEHLQEFQGYNSTVAPDIYTEFSTGAFRYGHSEVNSWLYRLDSGHHPIPQGHLRLFSNYFNSQSAILSAGIESILRGMAQQSQGAVDVIFVDDLKNFLNGLPGSGGSDLISINTQRGRDHGLPGINDYRASYGLKPYVHWAEINPDARIWQSLSNTYESIDDCDVYVCGLAEVPFSYLSNLGETFFTAVGYQYDQIKNGDRFWYEADGYLSEATLTEVRKTTLAELIVRNTNIQKDELQCFVMALPDGCGASISPPIGLKYDFLVTLQPKTPASPLFGLENDFGFAINGLEGPTLVLQRGKTYTFYAQVSCNHAFLISTTPDVGEGDNLPYENSVNNLACMNQNPLVSLVIDDKTPSNLYYMCGIHSWMGGNITVLDAPVVSTASPSINYVYVPVPEFKYDIGPSVALAVLIPVAIIIILAVCVAYMRERKRQRLIAAENQLRGTVTLDEIKG